MGRWEPDAAGRLREAAMALYTEQGFERTTVAEIADRAGVTARTFFRHFADKREVLFAGSEELEQRMIGALAAAPPSAGPMDAIAAALLTVAELFADRRDYSRRRQAVIAATPELRERELIKMSSLATAFAEAHAMLGDRRSSEQALGTADAHFSQIQPDDPAIDLSPTQPGPPGRRSSGRQPRYAG